MLLPFTRVEVSGIFSEMSDVYGFGVFLLELVTGVQAPDAGTLGPHGNLMQWVGAELEVSLEC